MFYSIFDFIMTTMEKIDERLYNRRQKKLRKRISKKYPNRSNFRLHCL